MILGGIKGEAQMFIENLAGWPLDWGVGDWVGFFWWFWGVVGVVMLVGVGFYLQIFVGWLVWWGLLFVYEICTSFPDVCMFFGKKGPWWLCRVYRGDDTTQLYGNYFIYHELRIPSLSNQYFWTCSILIFRASFLVSPLVKLSNSRNLRMLRVEVMILWTRSVARPGSRQGIDSIRGKTKQDGLLHSPGGQLT